MTGNVTYESNKMWLEDDLLPEHSMQMTILTNSPFGHQEKEQ